MWPPWGAVFCRGGPVWPPWGVVMQKLAEICIRRPVFAAMIILALVVVGAASYGRLGVDRFPSVDLPTVSIRTTLPGSSTEETESEVSQIIEEAVNTVDGIDELRSVSSGNTSFVIATFNLNRDIESAAQDIRDRIAGVVRKLPLDVQPPVVSKFNNDSSPVMSIALSGNRSLRELTEYADKVIKIQLERSPGVGEVQLVGGLQRAINIWMDPGRLSAYGIPITTVRQALVRQNAEAPGGNVTSGPREQTLRTMGRYQNPEELNDLVVATINGQPVRVRDLGSAEDGTKEQRSIARLDGVPTVSLDIRRQSGANTVAVIDGVKEALARVQSQLPPDLKIEIIRDQSEYIHSALHEINLHLILASIFASLVVLAFMGSWRSTVIAAVAIPASVIATFGMMKALDFPLNSARMLRAEGAASGHGEHPEKSAAKNEARSRQGFYARLDRGYERLLRFTMAHRRAAALICLGVMIASIPLYKLVKVEYIPSDVDESQFEINVRAPEGTSLAGIDEAMRAIEADVRQVHGVRSMLATAGGGFLGGVNQGNVFVRVVPSEERKFSVSRFLKGLVRLDPAAAFRDNYSQQEVMTDVRARLEKYKDLRCAVRNIQSFNIGGGGFEIDFALRGPDLQALASYAEQLRLKSNELGGIVDADTTLKLDRPELRVQVDRDRAARLGVDMSDVANALNLMVGGDEQVSRFHDPDVNDDYDIQLRLAEGERNDRQAILGLFVPGRDGKLYQLGNF